MHRIIITISQVAKEDIFMKFNIRCGRWIFSPDLLSATFTLLLICLFVYLGCWQLHRAEEKGILKKQLESRIKEPALLVVPLSDTKTLENVRYRRLQATGVFLNNKQILLDNQILEKRIGYRVITPFLTAANKILLVDRGWIPMGKHRNDLPIIEPSLGKVSIEGMINQFANGIRLSGTISTTSTFPRVVQLIDFKELSTILAFDVLPFILQLRQPSSLTFSIPTVSFGISESRHLGYAVQWLGLALAAFMYYLIHWSSIEKCHTK